MNQVGVAGCSLRGDADLLDALDDGGQSLIVRRDLLASLGVVELAAVVIGMVVRRADVNPTLGRRPSGSGRTALA